MNQLSRNLSFKNATGAISYNMTNDYMFRAVLQKSQKVLTALICSLLHFDEKELTSVEITNPIELGKNCEAKEFWLDVNIMLNNSTKINLEMQVVNQGNWTDRSLSYLCRSYDALYRGQKYTVTLPVIHIGFLDYTLFKDAPEFYATYKMLNIKNHHVYSDKLQVGVVDLSQIELATEEDRHYGIDHWAAIFKAGTWEELKAMTAENKVYEEAAQTMFELVADENVQELCRRREDYYRQIRTYEKGLSDYEKELSDKKKELSDKKKELSDKKKELVAKEKELAAKDAEIAQINSDKDAEIAALKAQLAQISKSTKSLLKL